MCLDPISYGNSSAVTMKDAVQFLSAHVEELEQLAVESDFAGE